MLRRASNAKSVSIWWHHHKDFKFRWGCSGLPFVSKNVFVFERHWLYWLTLGKTVSRSSNRAWQRFALSGCSVLYWCFNEVGIHYSIRIKTQLLFPFSRQARDTALTGILYYSFKTWIFQIYVFQEPGHGPDSHRDAVFKAWRYSNCQFQVTIMITVLMIWLSEKQIYQERRQSLRFRHHFRGNDILKSYYYQNSQLWSLMELKPTLWFVSW